MKKIYLTWLCTVLLTLITGSGPAFAQFVSSDIEKERVRPQEKIELPKVQTVPDAVDYFFEPRAGSVKPGEKYPVVHMRIPKASYFEKNSPSGPKRSYGIHITMFYPNFSGMADPENFECHEDAKSAAGKLGFCRRQVNIGFGFAWPGAFSEELMRKNLIEKINKGHIKPSSKKSKYFELDLVGTNGSDTTYYLSQNTKDSSNFVIECFEKEVSPACKTNFRATKSPYIYVSLTFVMALLPQWKELIEKSRDKIDNMIIGTYELSVLGKK